MNKGRPSRPHDWKSGPDPVAHAQYYAWLKHRSQAWYRKEGHDLTFEQWQTIWNTDNNWIRRGNHSSGVVLTRYDREQSWNVDNCYIKNRKEHRAEAASETHLGKTYRPRVNSVGVKVRKLKIIHR
jgi:hypothetical protein